VHSEVLSDSEVSELISCDPASHLLCLDQDPRPYEARPRQDLDKINGLYIVPCPQRSKGGRNGSISMNKCEVCYFKKPGYVPDRNQKLSIGSHSTTLLMALMEIERDYQRDKITYHHPVPNRVFVTADSIKIGNLRKKVLPEPPTLASRMKALVGSQISLSKV
jgi:hypothetical protein